MAKRIQLNEAQLKQIIKEAVENVFNDSELEQEPSGKTNVSNEELKRRMMDTIKWYRKSKFSNDINSVSYYLGKLGTTLNGLFKLLEKEYGVQGVGRVKERAF
jgi:Zn-dependent oligopeptidase